MWRFSDRGRLRSGYPAPFRQVFFLQKIETDGQLIDEFFSIDKDGLRIRRHFSSRKI